MASFAMRLSAGYHDVFGEEGAIRMMRGGRSSLIFAITLSMIVVGGKA